MNMGRSVVVDPVSRIEGHLKVTLEIEQGAVQGAQSSGEMFRGFESILVGRDPGDAQHITQRICGVCPISHGIASSLAQEQAYGIAPTRNGRVLRNLLLAANTIQSHVIHFYQLAALDYIDVTAILQYAGKDPGMLRLAKWAKEELRDGRPHPVAPLLPRMEGTYLASVSANVDALGHYVKALEIRRTLHEMIALFAGKMPHATGLVPGGVTGGVDARRIAGYRSRLRQVRDFVETAFAPDVVALGRAFGSYFEMGRDGGNLLSYGGLQQADDRRFHVRGVVRDGRLEDFDDAAITEDHASSYFRGPSGLHPTRGVTDPQESKPGAYSWIKAPRYGGAPMEVGPLARVKIAALAEPDHPVVRHARAAMRAVGRDFDDLGSAMGRHVARLAECLALGEACEQWITELVPDERTAIHFEVPDQGRGVGLVEAPRGALGHWLEIRDRRISAYQCVVPTTWNCSPRDDRGIRGPVETALMGVRIADADHPIEAMRVVRSFDPCLACAVH